MANSWYICCNFFVIIMSVFRTYLCCLVLKYIVKLSWVWQHLGNRFSVISYLPSHVFFNWYQKVANKPTNGKQFLTIVLITDADSSVYNLISYMFLWLSIIYSGIISYKRLLKKRTKNIFCECMTTLFFLPMPRMIISKPEAIVFTLSIHKYKYE